MILRARLFFRAAGKEIGAKARGHEGNAIGLVTPFSEIVLEFRDGDFDSAAGFVLR